jgi:hypothetical protein
MADHSVCIRASNGAPVDGSLAVWGSEPGSVVVVVDVDVVGGATVVVVEEGEAPVIPAGRPVDEVPEERAEGDEVQAPTTQARATSAAAVRSGALPTPFALRCRAAPALPPRDILTGAA